jgi:uncharacterized membrane protein YphA (DoxX/SURF4 family)
MYASLSKSGIFSAIRIAFGGVFILSGIMKFIDLNSFYIAVAKFKLIDEQYLDIIKCFTQLTEKSV